MGQQIIFGIDDTHSQASFSKITVKKRLLIPPKNDGLVTLLGFILPRLLDRYQKSIRKVSKTGKQYGYGNLSNRKGSESLLKIYLG